MKKLKRRPINRTKYNKNAFELDIMLDALHEDILITDGKGKILNVSKSFENVYGITAKEITGKTVNEMEKEGLFKPSIVAIALAEKKKTPP